ncbi:hypothetical protein PO909_013720 [Leuciscus waleckii]
MCALISFVSCADDSECANNEKCCNNGCGLQCTAPVTGVCPRTNNEVVSCRWKGEELCADDSECPKKQKCCSTACGGRQCTAPVTVKPGVCPSTKYEAEVCAWIRFVSCADDSECPKNEKCCSNGCGLQCMAPDTVKPGVCPRTNYEVVRCKRKGEELCADDSECPKKEKCCSTACGGRQCTAPVTVKPGVCPSTKYEAEGEELCASDSECPDNQKCCSTMCNGLDCMAPVRVKPGVCPRTNYEVVRCKRKGEELCADDSECPKKEKCCSTACGGRQCTAPVTVKPGVCPRRKYKPEICARIRFASCANDSVCPKNEKCCNNGCGLQCMAPVTGIIILYYIILYYIILYYIILYYIILYYIILYYIILYSTSGVGSRTIRHRAKWPQMEA